MKFYNINLEATQVLKYEPVTEYDSDQHKVNKDGLKKYAVELLCETPNGGFEVETVKFDSLYDPSLTIGSKPTIENLRLLFWQSGDRSGVSLLADSVSTGPASSSSKASDKKVTAAV